MGSCGVPLKIPHKVLYGPTRTRKYPTRPYLALGGLVRPCLTHLRALWGLVGSCGVLWGLVGSCGVFLKIPHKVLFGPTRPSNEPNKALFGLGQPCETLFDSFEGLVGSCGVLWGLVGSCGVLWGIFENTPQGVVWAHKALK